MTVMNKQTEAKFRASGFTVVTQPPWTETANAAISGPPARPEPLGTQFSGRDQQTVVDRFSRNPAVEYLRLTVKGGFVGQAPSFFAVGDLPPFCASGIPPEQLLWVAWVWRHSAALAPDRGYVLELIERSQDDVLDVDRLQLSGGAHHLADYMKRCWNWASVMPSSEDVSLATPDEAIASMFRTRD
jgi:hypothetical protein